VSARSLYKIALQSQLRHRPGIHQQFCLPYRKLPEWQKVCLREMAAHISRRRRGEVLRVVINCLTRLRHKL
jgi:hypothetical protein